MTLREKIADRILKGGLTLLEKERGGWEELYRTERDNHLRTMKEESRLHDLCITAEVMLTTKDQYLQGIAAQETPGANATVRRMARMAREGYGG